MVIYAYLDLMYKVNYSKIFLIIIVIFSIIASFVSPFIFKPNNFFSFIILILVTVEIVFLCCLPFYIVMKSIDFKKNVKSIENNIPKFKNINYYRDTLEGISPGILSFILNKKINYKDDVMATIFSLIIRKYIKLEDKKIIILEKDISQLSDNEKFVLDSFSFLFPVTKFRKRWTYRVISDSVYQGYMRNNHSINPFFILIIIFLFIFNLMFYESVMNAISSEFFFNLYFINFGLGIVVPLLYGIADSYHGIRYKYTRTEKGTDVYLKLMGLKKFLMDFSSIDKKTIEELHLWEDYMIYAIIFDIPGILDKETKKEFDKLKEYRKFY